MKKYRWNGKNIFHDYEKNSKELESHTPGLDWEYRNCTAILSKQGDECHGEINYQPNEHWTERDQRKPLGYLDKTFKRNRTIRGMNKRKDVYSDGPKKWVPMVVSAILGQQIKKQRI